MNFLFIGCTRHSFLSHWSWFYNGKIYSRSADRNKSLTGVLSVLLFDGSHHCYLQDKKWGKSLGPLHSSCCKSVSHIKPFAEVEPVANFWLLGITVSPPFSPSPTSLQNTAVMYGLSGGTTALQETEEFTHPPWTAENTTFAITGGSYWRSFALILSLNCLVKLIKVYVIPFYFSACLASCLTLFSIP